MSTRNTPVYGAPLKCWRCFCRPPSAWTLHPAATTPAPAVVEPVEKKVPKGVPLQFDINSVGKPVRTRPPMSGPQKGRGGRSAQASICVSTANVDDPERAVPHPERQTRRHVTHRQRQPVRDGGLAAAPPPTCDGRNHLQERGWGRHLSGERLCCGCWSPSPAAPPPFLTWTNVSQTAGAQTLCVFFF